jgi:hypothetical protein
MACVAPGLHGMLVMQSEIIFRVMPHGLATLVASLANMVRAFVELNYFFPFGTFFHWFSPALDTNNVKLYPHRTLH